ncbi:hypothetical protein INT45_008062 [Circinella minor]|uniref:Uncharacterized protein n=1 Tax=Circinella minor TaxID=1195481 RepID=A0A8H7REX4_9FUNG|nr:hypothetical protein INT45_008062 [Circinella minor]
MKASLVNEKLTLSIALSASLILSYADGIGYSTTVGVLDEERIMVEWPSGGREENVQHTYGDSLKLLKSLTAILVLKAYKRCHAKYTTFFQVQNYWHSLY